MTSKRAKRLVLLGVTIAAAGTALGQLRRGRLAGPQLALGSALAIVVLSITSEFAPKFAAGLTTTMALTAWLASEESAQGLAKLAGASKDALSGAPPGEQLSAPPHIQSGPPPDSGPPEPEVAPPA